MSEFLSSGDFVIRYTEKCGDMKRIFNYKVDHVIIDSHSVKLVSDDVCFVNLVQSYDYLQESINIEVFFKGVKIDFVCSDVKCLSSSDEIFFWVEVILYKD